MNDDTRIGGAASRFPPTRRSAIVASQSGQPEERRQAFDKIIAAYWKPVYKFIRMRWSLTNEDAKDLTQTFFARALEKNFLKDYRSEIGTFRTFIRTCATHFVINESKYAQRLKRGGGGQEVPLDGAAEPEAESIQEFFDKEYIRSLFSLALDDLRNLCAAQNKATHFALFEAYDIERSTSSYAGAAAEYRVSVSDVTNYLSWTRKEFRRLVLEHIREITADDAEFRREARLILGQRP